MGRIPQASESLQTSTTEEAFFRATAQLFLKEVAGIQVGEQKEVTRHTGRGETANLPATSEPSTQFVLCGQRPAFAKFKDELSKYSCQASKGNVPEGLSTCRKISTLPQQLVSSVTGSVDPGHSSRLQNRIPVSLCNTPIQ